MGFHTTVTLRYFRSRRGFVSLVSAFSVLGIMLGVGALIVVMSVMTGFREELLTRMLGVTGHMTITSSEYTLKNSANDLEFVAKNNNVKKVQTFVQGQGLVMNGGRASGILVRGVQNLKSSLPTQAVVVSGEVNALSRARHVAIGSALAKKMGLGVGSIFTLVAPQGEITIAGFIPRMKKFKVGAIFEVGLQAYDSGWLYMNMKDAQKFYGVGEKISGLDIRLHNPENVSDLRGLFYKNLTGKNLAISTWQDMNRDFFEALQVEKVAMFIILTLIVVVAAFNIITGQTMSVNDKRADIAILRTMGARRRDILNIFFLNGTLNGILGTGLGVGGGVLIVVYLQTIVNFLESVFHVAIFSGGAYFLEELPARLVWQDVAGIAALSMSLAMLASLYPAWRAAMLDPVEVLRHE